MRMLYLAHQPQLWNVIVFVPPQASKLHGVVVKGKRIILA